jgi:GxxExxY protein
MSLKGPLDLGHGEIAVTLKHEALTEKIIGVFYDVYNELGYGFLESAYEESMVIALRDCGLNVERQVPIPVWFRSHKVRRFQSRHSG